jgi:hypothetical protein
MDKRNLGNYVIRFCRQFCVVVLLDDVFSRKGGSNIVMMKKKGKQRTEKRKIYLNVVEKRPGIYKKQGMISRREN